MKNTSDWVQQAIQSSNPPDALSEDFVISSKPFQKFSDKYLASSSSSSSSDSDSNSRPAPSKPQAGIRSLKFEISTNSFINKISSIPTSSPQPVQKQQLHTQQIIEGLESATNLEEDDFWKKSSSSDSSGSSFGDTESEIESSRKSSLQSGRVQSNMSAVKPLENKVGGVFGTAFSGNAKENKPSVAKSEVVFDIKLEDLNSRDSRVSNVSESKARISKLAIPTFEDTKVNDIKVELGINKSLPSDANKATALNFRFPKEIPPPVVQSIIVRKDSEVSTPTNSSLPSISQFRTENSRPKILISSKPKLDDFKVPPSIKSPENSSLINPKSSGVPSVPGKYLHSPTAIDMAGKYITSELSSSSSEEPSVRYSNIHLPGLPALNYEESQDRQLSIDIRPDESADESKISIPNLPFSIKTLATYSKPNLKSEFPNIQSDSEAESLESSSDSSLVAKMQAKSIKLGSPSVLPPKPEKSPKHEKPIHINIQMPLSSPPQTDEIHMKPEGQSQDSSRYSEIRTSSALQSQNDILTIEEAFSILYTENLTSEINKISKQIEKSSKGGCFACFSGKSNRLVNRSEKDLRNRILALSLVRFNDLNPFHLRMLMSIWRLMTGAIINCPRTGKQWRELGFKTDDPTQELNNVGVLGLFLLLFLSSIFTADVKKMLARSSHPQLGFHFANLAISMASITISICKERKLNAIINKRNPANEVIMFFYAGLMIQWFLTYSTENFDETRGLAYIQEVEQYAKKHPDEILMLAKSRLNQIR